jgi:4-amino-4-deoxy-L-arabinose transferase-like glycosyltransferase
VESGRLPARLRERAFAPVGVRRPSLPTLERIGVAALVALTLIGFAIYPSYPSYDSIYALVWGGELVAGEAPSFEAFRAPTEHPLAIAVSVLLQPLGGGADRVLVLLHLLAFVAVVVAVYRLGRDSFSAPVGLAAALVLLSRFDFPYLAIRAFVDIPFMAAVLWAAVLEYERPRRGGAVWLLLAAAGLLRPEGWALLGLYWLWMSFGRGLTGETWRRRLRWLGYASAPAAVWIGIDWAVTGDPLFSFETTSETVSELDRGEDLADLPGALFASFEELLKPPVLLAGLAGLALALWLVPRRALMPGIVLLTGVATFLAIGIGGFAVIDRYLIVAAGALCVFAGFALAGFTAVEEPRALRVAWAAGSAAVIVAVLAFTLTRTLQVESFAADLDFRTDGHASLERVLDSDPVTAAIERGCGPVSTPTHKLIPDVRWVLDADEDEVVSRSDPDADTSHGIAVYVHGRRGLELQGFDGDTSPLTEVPPAGFERIAVDEYYTVWARC